MQILAVILLCVCALRFKTPFPIIRKFYWINQKDHLVFFPPDGSSSFDLSLTSFSTTLLDCIVTTIIYISVHLKKTSKLENFCAAILILKMKEDMQDLGYIMLYYFKKGKHTTGTDKDLCSAWRRRCD